MTATQNSANALLGYPDDARLLILNADDLGMCHAVNEAIFNALETGPMSSCTLMVPCSWSLHAIKRLKRAPGMSFGVHLTVISEAPDYRWGPLTCRQDVPSLLDEMGYFYSEARMAEFLDKVDIRELEKEYRAQIEWVLDHGLAPTHLDSHCGTHTRHQEAFEMTVGLAREYGLALRAYGRQLTKPLLSRGYPTLEHELLDSYTINPADKHGVYREMLRDLPVGLSEWALHPGLDTAELYAIEPSTRETPVRPTDYVFFTSAEAKELIDNEGITVLDYRALQEVWRTVL